MMAAATSAACCFAKGQVRTTERLNHQVTRVCSGYSSVGVRNSASQGRKIVLEGLPGRLRWVRPAPLNLSRPSSSAHKSSCGTVMRKQAKTFPEGGVEANVEAVEENENKATA